MTHSSEPQGGDDIRRVSRELADRLRTLGIQLSGSEHPEELLDMVEAIGRFETAVEHRGGDLMVDEGPHGRTSEPDDRHFALPTRHEHEPVSQYLDRLARATEEVRRHPPRAD